MLDKLKAGVSLADIAAADQLMVEAKWGLKRQGTDIMPAWAIAQIFRTAKDAYGSAEGKTATERIVLRVTDIKIPAFDANSPAAKCIFDQLKNPTMTSCWANTWRGSKPTSAPASICRAPQGGR
jgi:hypothetical protein